MLDFELAEIYGYTTTRFKRMKDYIIENQDKFWMINSSIFLMNTMV